MGKIDRGEGFISRETRRTIKRVISSALIVALGVLQGPSQAENINQSMLRERLNGSNTAVGFVDFYSYSSSEFLEAVKLFPLIGTKVLFKNEREI